MSFHPSLNARGDQGPPPGRCSDPALGTCLTEACGKCGQIENRRRSNIYSTLSSTNGVSLPSGRPSRRPEGSFHSTRPLPGMVLRDRPLSNPFLNLVAGGDVDDIKVHGIGA